MVRVRVRVKARAWECITSFLTKCGENLVFVVWIAPGCI